MGSGGESATPWLTPRLGPGWLRLGDMMSDGVLQQMVLQPLIVSGLSPLGRVGSDFTGQLAAVHRSIAASG